MSKLCVIIARKRQNKIHEEMEAIRKSKVGLLEIRLDFLAKAPRLREILEHRHCPLIGTVRRESDGGLWKGSEQQRVALLRTLIVEGFDYVDLEHDVAQTIPRFGATKRIVSYHNFNGVPEDLEGIVSHMRSCDPDVIKVACRANHVCDMFDMFRLMRNSDVPMIAFCMGELGMASRILAGKFGAPFTYASFNQERIVAPGLIDWQTMREDFRVEGVNKDTEMFAVLGDPVSHSLSPTIHNGGFSSIGFNGVYVPIRLPKDQLERFFREVPSIGFKGFSVTIPHKSAITKFGRIADSLVLDAGAANTMIAKEKSFELFNTDGPAAGRLLERVIPPHPETNDKSLHERVVLILGAGGAARTVGSALRRTGCLLSITARRSEESQKLAQELGCTAVPWAERHARVSDVLINCTSVGMAPKVEETPYHAGALREGMVVFDTVYSPEKTRLLQDAVTRNCIVVSGIDMLLEQAADQFLMFTGTDMPREYCREMVREQGSPAKRMLREIRLGKIQDSQSVEITAPMHVDSAAAAGVSTSIVQAPAQSSEKSLGSEGTSDLDASSDLASKSE